MRQVRGLQDGPAIPKPRRALPTAGRSRSRRRPVGKTASRSARTRQSPPASSRVSSRRYREKRRRGRVWQRGATDDPPLRERLWHRPVSGPQEWGLSRNRPPLGQDRKNGGKGKRVSGCGDLGGRWIHKKNKQ